MTAEERLAELGITLPQVPRPRWAYAPAVRSGNLVFVSGQIATESGRILHPGKLGREVDVERGREAARGCAIAALAVVARSITSHASSSSPCSWPPPKASASSRRSPTGRPS